MGDIVSPQNKLNRQRLAKVPKWWKHGRYSAALAQPASSAAPLLDETLAGHIPIHTSACYYVRLFALPSPPSPFPYRSRGDSAHLCFFTVCSRPPLVSDWRPCSAPPKARYLAFLLPPPPYFFFNGLLLLVVYLYKRSTMEDEHNLVMDANTMFGLDLSWSTPKSSSASSATQPRAFFGIYDGL